MTRVKICGITNVDDALAAVDAGADMIGFVFADSPRRVTADEAGLIVPRARPGVVTVGVFRNQERTEVLRTTESAHLDMIQLHGTESFSYCAFLGRGLIKRFDIRPGETPEQLAMRVAKYGTALTVALLDPGEGSGQTFDWNVAHAVEWPVMIAGGLRPDNVGVAVRTARPYGVDVSSGVESAPGRKDHAKIRAFIDAVREADADTDTTR